MAEMQPFVQHWKEFSSSSRLQHMGLGTGRKKVVLGEEEFIKCCHSAKGERTSGARWNTELTG